ncbi:MAG: hypothetical protein A4E63_00373 [Syntrophorhabdus sp. PtaU1.Bin050]|nr:MAG: hypothetical protein A4E63_00373 [Syntrophorhabdus sp. PtaU1.Bin050]
MIVIEQLSAEFQIELVAEVLHPLEDLLGLLLDIFLIVETHFLDHLKFLSPLNVVFQETGGKTGKNIRHESAKRQQDST